MAQSILEERLALIEQKLNQVCDELSNHYHQTPDDDTGSARNGTYGKLTHVPADLAGKALGEIFIVFWVSKDCGFPVTRSALYDIESQARMQFDYLQTLSWIVSVHLVRVPAESLDSWPKEPKDERPEP